MQVLMTICVVKVANNDHDGILMDILFGFCQN